MKKFLPYLLFIGLTFCFTTNVFSQCVSTFPYSEGFESSAAWTSGGTNSDWAWGTPTHPTINSAGGGSKCWCIGGLNGSFYNFSEQSYLTSPCFDFSNLNWPSISFKIFWENEFKWDGLVLQYSTTNGASWNNVGAFGDANDCNTMNWYNYNNISWLSSASVKHGWTGRIGATSGSCSGGNGSGGWLIAKHCLQGLANQPNVKFRFLFGSGTSCNNFDGIAIDDIYISNGTPNVAGFTFACRGDGNYDFTSTGVVCPVSNSWAWDFGDPSSGITNVSSVQFPKHQFTSPGNYTVKLIVGGGQCNPPDTITKIVSVSGIANPVVQNVTCFGLSNGSISAPASGVGPFNYTWSPSGGTSSTIGNLSAGNYSVVMYDANNCVYSKTTSVIQPSPFTANLNSINAGCGSQNGSATVTPAGGTPAYSYSWSGTSVSSAIASLAQGIYTVVVADANNCIVTLTTQINQSSPLVLSVEHHDPLCYNANDGSANIIVSGGTPGYNYLWSPFGGSQASALNLSAGNYEVSVKDADNCVSTISVTLVQPEQIIADFSASTFETDIYEPTVEFYNLSSGASNYSWQFGNEGVSVLKDPSFTFLTENKHKVMLIAMNSAGCWDTLSRIINVKSDFTFYAPDAFTPNGDGLNDIFIPIGLGWQKEGYELSVYDRWGENIFHTSDYSKGWNGVLKNGNVQEAVYVWKARVKDRSNKAHEFVGKLMVEN